MLSTQPQARPPVRFFSRCQTALASATALASFSPFSHAAVFEDSSATLETRNMYFNRDFRDGTRPCACAMPPTVPITRPATRMKCVCWGAIALPFGN
ncbi:hypothetical protein PS691_02061 [Pseudomonas fluorescens]|uniref:Outer membrane porin n=1 Tax=Pseudomonas fluorescens TaxID=294 RepID=A0A5E7CDJ8_PSEFL|nr:hypothetical protein PS691_02061 [Pseudomonas fluorescens]